LQIHIQRVRNVSPTMNFRIPDSRIPETEPWANREFLEWAYHERGLSPRAIAYELGVSKSHVTVHMERLGVVRPWRHRPTLRRLYVEEGLSPDEIAARDAFDCTATTVRKWLARHDLINYDPSTVSYGRLDEISACP
jgi:transposase